MRYEATVSLRMRQVAQPFIAQVAEFLTRFGRLVVLGDPGAGKSTLLSSWRLSGLKDGTCLSLDLAGFHGCMGSFP